MINRNEFGFSPTPESLHKDNNSPAAKENLDLFEEAKGAKRLVGVFRCADSRLVLPVYCVELSSIAGGGPRSPYSETLEDPSIPVFVMLSHHDGDTVQPEQTPSGCGGREAKENLSEINEFGDEGIYRFLKEHVWDSDVYKQAVVGASFTAERARKPVLAATQDHLDLRIYPMGYIYGQDNKLPIPLHFILAQNYFANKTYQNGIPMIDTEGIPDILRRFLENNTDQQHEYGSKYRLRAMQKKQAPTVVVISTGFMSPRFRYPETFEVPGSAFHLSLAQRQVDGSVLIDPGQLMRASDQLQYPVEHFPIRTILIETRDLSKSAIVAQSLEGKPFMEEWFSDRRNRILIAETSLGRTHYIDQYK